MVHAIGGVGDVDFTRQDTTPKHGLGLTVQDNEGGSWCYVKAGAALTAYLCYKLLGTVVGSATAKDDAVDSNSASFTGGFGVCWPQAAFTSGKYGWVQLSSGSGTLEADVAASLTAGELLATSETAGRIGAKASTEFNFDGEVRLVDTTTAAGTYSVRVPVPVRVDTLAIV